MTEIVEQKIYLLFFSSVLYTPIVKSLIAPRALMLASFIFSFIAIAFSCYKISSPLSILAIITLSNFLYSILFLPSVSILLLAVFFYYFSNKNLPERQPHLMPHDISMCGFIRNAFILKSKLCIIKNQFILMYSML